MKAAACLIFCGLGLWAAKPPKEVFDQAVKDLTDGNYTAAEQEFQSVLHEQPQNVGALSNLGVIYSRTNRADQAIAMYQRALKVSPNDEALLLNLGLVYLRQEAHLKALPLFARVVEIDPRHMQARQLLALCRVYAAQLAPAISDLEALNTANPHDAQILFLLGFAYLKNKEPERAKAVFQQMFEATSPARAQFLLGRAYYEAVMFRPAEESFLEALRLDPTLPGLHLELGKVYISQHRSEDAIRELQLVLKEHPGDADANYFLGSLLVQFESRYSDAVPYLEQAKKAKPDAWATYFYLGKAKLRLERPAEAVTLLQRAVELNPDEASAYFQLSQALRACGRKTEATRALQKVQELRTAELEGETREDGIAGAR